MLLDKINISLPNREILKKKLLLKNVFGVYKIMIVNILAKATAVS